MGQETTESSLGAVSDKSRSDTVIKNIPKQRFFALYRKFRRSGLSKLDSAFNAFYICESNKLCNMKIDVKHADGGFFAHPKGWFKESREAVRRASETKSLRLLELCAKVLAPFSKSVESKKRDAGVFLDNSVMAMSHVKRNWRRAMPACIVASLAVLFATVIINDAEKHTVIEVSVDGTVVGEVSSAETVSVVLERVNSKISSITGKEFSFPYEVSYSLVNKKSTNCLDINSLSEIFYDYTSDYITTGYGLYIDSKLVAVLENRDDILDALAIIESEHTKLTENDERIANKVDIKYKEYSPDDVMTKDALVSLLTEEKKPANEADKVLTNTETTLLGASTPTIMTFGDGSSELERELLALREKNQGDAVSLDFEVLYTETVREAIPFETTYIYDDKAYEGQEVVRITGRNGLADNTYVIHTLENEEVSRELVSQDVIRAPRDCVIKVGTRVLPENMPSHVNGGRYMINPAPDSYVTDHYGWRILRGRSDHHEGLDLCAFVGTPIYAAASGEVIHSGYSSSYGYMLKILHEDGTITLYAHCSKLLVKSGDVVSQGDKIALVGETGDVTGPHLHFEVIVDEERVDPEKYIYSMD